VRISGCRVLAGLVPTDRSGRVGETEILGQHFSRFYIDEDRAARLPTLALAAAAKDGRFEGEGWRVRKDGSRFWANVIIDPIRNPAGELVGYAKITRDLSERRDAQLSLERTREVLFQRRRWRPSDNLPAASPTISIIY
jgi:hypothetical protein